MSTAEIVEREVQGDRSFQVRQLLAERIGEPRKAPNLHSHRQVLPFHVASRDVVRIGIASANLGYNLRDSWWGVPPFVVLPIVSEQLDQLRESTSVPKASGTADV